jgi:hypothetical protein
MKTFHYHAVNKTTYGGGNVSQPAFCLESLGPDRQYGIQNPWRAGQWLMERAVGGDADSGGLSDESERGEARGAARRGKTASGCHGGVQPDRYARDNPLTIPEMPFRITLWSKTTATPTQSRRGRLKAAGEMPVAFEVSWKIPCWVWEGCMAGILEDIAVVLPLDAVPEGVRSKPRKGRSPRFFSILRPTNAPYGAHYERGEASPPIPKPPNVTGETPALLCLSPQSGSRVKMIPTGKRITPRS